MSSISFDQCPRPVSILHLYLKVHTHLLGHYIHSLSLGQSLFLVY